MRPLSAVVPKELFPLGTRPAIEWSVREAVGAGIREVGIIVSPRKSLLRDYLDTVLLPSLPEVRFEYLVQHEAKGLAEALYVGREFAAGEPFGVLLPDNVFLDPRHDYAAMVSSFDRLGSDVIGVMELGEEHSGQFGNCGALEFDDVDEQTIRIRRWPDKKKGRLVVPPGETVLRNCGRYVCAADFFDWTDRVRSSVQGEYDEVPVYQRILRERAIYGHRLPAPNHDVGNPDGYAAAWRQLTQSS